jgi:hypothetical protein
MPDFSQLLRKPAGEAKLPPPLPPADYPAVVSQFEFREAPADNSRKVIVRLFVKLTGWPEAMEVGDRPEGAKVEGRQMRKDFYVMPKDESENDTGLFFLDETIRSCGIEPAGRPYEEVIPELVGRQVLVEMQQYMNQRTSEIGNQIGKMLGSG